MSYQQFMTVVHNKPLPVPQAPGGASSAPAVDCDTIAAASTAGLALTDQTSEEPNRRTLAPDTTNPDSTPAKATRYADIIDIQTPDIKGDHSRIMLTDRYVPLVKRSDLRSQKKYEDHAVLLRRTLISDGNRMKLKSTNLELHCPMLCQAFRKLVGLIYDGLDITATPIKIPWPFYILFFNRDKIKVFVEENQHVTNKHSDSAVGNPREDPDNDSDIPGKMKLIHDFIMKDPDLKIAMDDYNHYVETRAVVTSRILWTIYRPGTLVVVDDGPLTRECWLCQSLYADEEMGKWILSGVRFDFNGSGIRLVRKTYIIPMFHGVQEITSLPIVPIQWLPNWKRVRGELIERGKQWKELLGRKFDDCSYMDYTGPIWMKQGPFAEAVYMDKQLQERGARVMVDYPQYMRMKAAEDRQRGYETATVDYVRAPRKKRMPKEVRLVQQIPLGLGPDPDSGSDTDYDDDTDDDNEDHGELKLKDEKSKRKDDNSTRDPDLELFHSLTTGEGQFQFEDPEEKFVLYPGRIPAFNFRTKQWIFAAITALRPISTWNNDAFACLEMPIHTKDLIKALVQGHGDGIGATFDDIVTGKGRGLLFLLHGSPGLGKTMTAESIAEYSRRPLYQVASGELSITVETLDKKLSEIFDVGKRWRAIVLLDEADVLMAKRDYGHLDRSAIVAVFLRILEYYEGILFLTTNRPVSELDEAIYNRLHVCIEFPPLTAEMRAKIWRNLVKSNCTELKGWTEAVYNALGEIEVNGRTIKNQLRTAACLAQAQNKKSIHVEHVYNVIRVNLAGAVGIKKALEGLDSILGRQ